MATGNRGREREETMVEEGGGGDLFIILVKDGWISRWQVHQSVLTLRV